MKDCFTIIKQEQARIQKRLDELEKEKDSGFTYNNFIAYHETLGAYKATEKMLNLIKSKKSA